MTGEDQRDETSVSAAYQTLLDESVALRFRSDVPVGINLSGGVDSSLLLALVHRHQGASSAVAAFTFTCGDARYDELPWVRRMLRQTQHPLHEVRLDPGEVPGLAADVHGAPSTSRSAACPPWRMPSSSPRRASAVSACCSTARAWTSSGPATTTTDTLAAIPRSRPFRARSRRRWRTACRRRHVALAERAARARRATGRPRP